MIKEYVLIAYLYHGGVLPNDIFVAPSFSYKHECQQAQIEAKKEMAGLSDISFTCIPRFKNDQ